MNADIADNSLVSLTLPESVENEVHAVNSSLSNASSFLPAKRGFKMACLNINSLVKHIDELRVLLSEFSVDILAINETKLDESIKSSELHIPGYEFIRRDRSRNGGGVGFYIKSSNSYVVRSDLNVFNLENLIIEIRKPNSRPFLIATWYRPPCSPTDLFSSYESFIDKVDSLDLEYYLLGDLNCNLASSTPDANTRHLLEISDLYGLNQLINEPTRVTESSSTLIDLIFTNHADKVSCSGVSHIGISDHSLVYVYRKLSSDLSSKGHSYISYRNFRNFNRDNFRNEISQQDWSFDESEDPNLVWSNWKTKFLRVVNSHAPIRTRRAKLNNSPWINSVLKNDMRCRDAAKKKAIKTKNPHDWANYRKLRNKINNNVKTTKASYYHNSLIQSEGNSRRTWKTINHLMSRRQNNQLVKEVKVNDISICNSNEISNTFNEHFSTIGPRLAREIPSTSDEVSTYLNNFPENFNKFSFRPTTSSIVFTHLNRLSKTKSTGLDNISAKLIRECADIISGPLCDLFNKSLMSGIFPDDWKCARVIPLFKQGESLDLNNYRPISVISVVAKVFERIVYDQLYNFLSNEGIISKQQSGFRSLHSTVSALLEATDSWAFNIDRGYVNAVVFLDLKKAFDTVDHEILLTKMNQYGIQGKSLDWFKSYLTNRTQRCSVNGCLSDFTTLKCGVPQGTILGPLLFLIYINDLPNCLSFSVPRMYADDTHITYAGSDLHLIQSSISHDLEKLSKWLVSNKLTLNATKTEFMLIGSRQRLSTLSDTLELSIDNVPIEKVSSVKSLGIYVDENLTWYLHVDKLCKKIASAIGAIKRVKPFLPQSTLISIYNSLVQPHFDYCSLVWGNCGKTLSNKLQKLQNRAARVITSSSYDADVNSLFHKLSWKDLNSQRQIQKALMVFKSLNGLVPEYLTSKFVMRNVSNYALRDSANKLVVPFPRTNYMKNSFSYSGATLWNSLHRNIRESSSIDQFKRLLYQNF